MRFSKKEVWMFGFLIAFIVVLYLIIGNSFEEIDLSVNQAMPLIQTSFLTSIAKAFALVFDIYSLLVISLVIAAILWIKNYKKNAGFFALTMLVNAGAIYLLKEIVAIARPLNSIIADSGFSFPSGHATSAVVFFGLLCYLTLKSKKSQRFKSWILVLSSLLVLLIGLSRIYLNLHWFSDVLGGFFLGGFILMLGISVKEIFD